MTALTNAAAGSVTINLTKADVTKLGCVLWKRSNITLVAPQSDDFKPANIKTMVAAVAEYLVNKERLDHGIEKYYEEGGDNTASLETALEKDKSSDYVGFYVSKVKEYQKQTAVAEAALVKAKAATGLDWEG